MIRAHPTEAPMRVRNLSFAPLALALLLAPALADEQTEDWQLITINGARAGHARSVRTVRQEDGRTVVESLTESKMSMARLGQTMEIETRASVVETVDGKVLRFSTRSGMSALPSETHGTVVDGTLRLRLVSGGSERTSEQPWRPEALMVEGGRLLMLQKGFAAGTKYSFTVWQPELNRFDEARVEVVGPEAIEVGGARVEATKVLSSAKAMPGIVTSSWVDAKGDTLLTEVAVMGMKIRTEKATREVALGQAPAPGEAPREGSPAKPPAAAPEVFLGSMPRSSVILPRPRRVTELVLRLSREEGFHDWDVPEGMELLGRDARSLRLRVTARPPAAPARLPAPAREDLAPFLRPSVSVQSDDPELVKKAREVVGGETDMLAAGKKLAGWVHAHIANKGYGIGAASAREVFKNKEGDCSEHAVLLAAMLRAAGIPSRVCSGYLYVYGAWGGHAWVSAWVGEWIDLDATIGSQVGDAARIKFSHTRAGEGDSLMEGMLGAAAVMNGLTIEVERYGLDGQPAAAAAPRVVVERQLRVPSLGLALDAPAGWSWIPADQVKPFGLATLEKDGAAIELEYRDLPTESAGQGLVTVAQRSGGKKTTIAGRPAIDAGAKVWIELSPEELLEVELKGGAPAREAFEEMVARMQLKEPAPKRWH